VVNSGYILKCPVYDIKGKGKGTGKAIPVQAWTSPVASRRARLPNFMTIGT